METLDLSNLNGNTDDRYMKMWLKLLDSFSLNSKTLWKKEELPLTSAFSFSNNVFKRCLLLMCQNKYLWSNGLKAAFVRISCTKEKSRI